MRGGGAGEGEGRGLRPGGLPALARGRRASLWYWYWELLACTLLWCNRDVSALPKAGEPAPTLAPVTALLPRAPWRDSNSYEEFCPSPNQGFDMGVAAGVLL